MRPGSGLFNDLSMTSVAACSGGVGVEGTAVHCLFRVGGVTVGRGAVVDHWFLLFLWFCWTVRVRESIWKRGHTHMHRSMFHSSLVPLISVLL